MKIIGLGKGENNISTLLVEITKDEFEKLLGTYYAQNIPGLNKPVRELTAGDSIDVSGLHNMTERIYSTSQKMIETMESFKKSQSSLLGFAEIVANHHID